MAKSDFTALYVKGARVWIPDKGEEVWRPCRVVRYEPGGKEIQDRLRKQSGGTSFLTLILSVTKII